MTIHYGTRKPVEPSIMAIFVSLSINSVAI
jgi:hypothetical protein